MVFEQYVIPQYRVPFFAALAQRVDLVVVASENREVDGVLDVRSDLPFAVARLPEYPGSVHHPAIGRCLEDHRAQVWISYDHYIERFPGGRAVARHVREHKIRRVHMGCDGYAVRDIEGYRRDYDSPFHEPRAFTRRLKERRHLRKLDGFVVYSSHSARFLQAVHDIPESLITVAHNAVDTSVTATKRCDDAVRARDPRRIAFVGRMSEGKGVDLLLHAFAQVSRRHPGSSLVLVGDGSLRREWEGLAADLGLANVDFLGPVFDERKLAEILCRSSLFVLPGLGGLALNTAMAAGLAVVCTHGDGTELDLVEEEVNGWHFGPGDRSGLAEILDRALADPERLAVMGAASAARLEERFSLTAMVDAYVRRIELSVGAAAHRVGDRAAPGHKSLPSLGSRR